MLICAGILFRAPDGTCLVLRRSGEGDCAGLWDLPGGKVEDGEDLATAAMREAEEEIGIEFDSPGTVLMRRVVDGVDYTTFLCNVPAPFLPILNDEHNGFAWIRADDALADQPPAMMPPTTEAAPMVNVPMVADVVTDSARADADFKESDHPRGDGGQFGTGSKVRIVTTHDADTVTTSFHHVGTDKDAADAAHDRVSADEDEDAAPEMHEEKVRGKRGERSDTLHIVHSSDGAGGTSIHGAHLSAGVARGRAHVASQAEWAENGPTRADAGLSDLEKTDMAQAFNDRQSESGDDVTIMVDDDGDPVLDASGDFQFEQDGGVVSLDDDRQADFDAVREDLYPGDERAAYPGLDDANDHFEGEGRYDAVFRVHEHKAAS